MESGQAQRGSTLPLGLIVEREGGKENEALLSVLRTRLLAQSPSEEKENETSMLIHGRDGTLAP